MRRKAWALVAPRSRAASTELVVEALQPGEEHQHAVGGDEGRLAEHGEEDAVVEDAAVAHAELRGDAVPEEHRGDAEHDTGDQDRRDEDGVVARPGAHGHLGQQERTGEPDGDGEEHHADADQDAVAASPAISRWSSTSRTNHSKVRHSQGLIRGKAELLKAVIDMITRGPKR